MKDFGERGGAHSNCSIPVVFNLSVILLKIP